MLGVNSLRQALNAQILRADAAEATDKIPGKLMQVVAPLVGDVRFILGFKKTCLAPFVRTCLASGECARSLSQSLRRFLCEIRSRQRLAGRQSDEAGQANVKADRSRAGECCLFDLDVEDDIHLPF